MPSILYLLLSALRCDLRSRTELWRHWPKGKDALVLVKPETVLRWHREGYRRYWRKRCGSGPGRPQIPRSHIAFICRISTDHPEWGEDKVALELKPRLGASGSRSR